MSRLRLSLLTLVATAGALLASGGHAQTRADLIPLGRSSASGAVCEAVRDYDDPVVQAASRRGWNIRCRGWDLALGHIYVLPNGAAEMAWSQALAARAACVEPKAETLAGLGSVQRRACHAAGSNATYVTYGAKKGSGLIVAEGASQIADVLETGVKVVAGVQKPPQMADLQVSAASAEIAADFGGASGGLARSQAAAQTDASRLRARAYVQNNEWRFEQAETDFQALVAGAQARGAPPREQGEAMLNLALNISNNGRFAEADRWFADAQAQVDQAQDPLLSAQAMGYRALHLRNQGKFDQAADAARAALKAGQQVRAARGLTDKGPMVTKAATGEVAIGADLSRALNTRPGAGGALSGSSIPLSDQLLIQDAQAWEVIGSSLAAQGETAAAREPLANAERLIAASAADGALNVWLQSRVEADLADLDMASGQPAQAATRLAAAIDILRTRHAGSATEGGLLLQLGRAQMGAGRDDAALVSFGRAFELFQAQRGSLGASGDDAAPYFDLLLKKIAADPAHADDYRGRFFSASETVVSNATAQTVSKLAARVASGDGAVTGLVRALDDTKRELRATEARVANLQAQGGYAGDAKVQLDAQLKTLQQQSDTLEAQLLAANPRYAQLVAATAALPDLQKALRKDEVYLKVILLGGHGYGMLVTPTAAKPYRVDLSRQQAASDVRAIRAPFEAEGGLPAFDVARSYSLFQKLAGRVKTDIAAARHLIYEPDGALISLPAAAFVMEDPSAVLAAATAGKDPDYRKVAWLGAKVDSSLVLSAPSFLQSRTFAPSRARQAFIAFADPASPKGEPRAFASVLKRSAGLGGAASANVCEGTRQALLRLPPLPDTAEEVRKVGATLNASDRHILVGKAFTNAAVRERADLGDYKVLYFATHGLLPQPSACLPEPALVTSVGADAESDGLLGASEILDLKIDADLVVLSACDTGGAGSEATDLTGLQGGGEALGGLTRAVIYAGGRALVVSHWSVDSAATVRLMTGLFSSRAPSEAEALQQAQTVLQKSAEWSHPFFWAPFTIVGDGARPMPSAVAQATVGASAGQR